MKREYKNPLTEVVRLNLYSILQSEGLDQDSTGTISGQDPGILVNETTFDEDEGYARSKNLWE